MNYKKTANIALAYIILSLISIPTMLMIVFFSFLPALHAIQSGATNLNELLFSNILILLIIIPLGVTNLVLFIIVLVNGFQLENKIGAILCSIGILVPVLSLVGSILIYIELKKKANESTKQDKKVEKDFL